MFWGTQLLPYAFKLLARARRPRPRPTDVRRDEARGSRDEKAAVGLRPLAGALGERYTIKRNNTRTVQYTRGVYILDPTVITAYYPPLTGADPSEVGVSPSNAPPHDEPSPGSAPGAMFIMRSRIS